MKTSEFPDYMMEVFRPIFERLAFDTQRIMVEFLLTQPPYKYLRFRWSLRKARKWS